MKKALFIIVLIASAAVVYIYNDPELRAYFDRKTGAVLKDVKQTTLYKWQNKQGQWQLSSDPPPAGTKYEVVEINSDTNVVPKETFTGRKEE